MTDPIVFSTTSPRFGLPLLFAGQSQKEVTVNEALLAADILLHPAVETILSAPPTTPSVGQSWLVGTSATGAFTSQTDRIAAWSDGGWRFVAPREGMRIYDIAAAAHRLYSSGSWRLVSAPAAPTGGTVVDTQARSAINAILSGLRTSGILG